MPLYKITLIYNTPSFAELEIEAASEDLARQQADHWICEDTNPDGTTLQWDISWDGATDTDIDEIERIA